MSTRVAVIALAAVGLCLLNRAPTETDAAWPGANGLVAYVERFNEAGIYTINPDGTGQTIVPETQGAESASWSPDGTKLAYQRTGFILSIDADGTDRITGPEGSDPTWTSNGLGILMDRDGDLFGVLPDGSDGIALTTTPENAENSPVASPDGSLIAFTGDDDPTASSDTTIWVMDANGDNPHSLGPTFENSARSPDWSPDGTHIAYSEDGDIWVMDADGQNQTRLTNDPLFETDPAWSPDGAKIAFSRRLPDAFQAGMAFPQGDNPTDIWTMDADGGNQQRLTNSTGESFAAPDWQPLGDQQLWGDADCDGEITTRDNQAILRFVLQQAPLTQTEPCPDIGDAVGFAQPLGGNLLSWGDVDCDEAVTTRDNQAILRSVLQQNPLSQTEPCPDIGTPFTIVPP